MDELKASAKPFDISKQEVWDAWVKVRGNKGSSGVDGVSVEAFEKDLKNNLYKVWNRMSSGTYFPPDVKAVPIPKSGGGIRVLGVPTVADRVAQTVVAGHLSERVEQIFHADSFGYRPGKSALDAVASCRERCWRFDWVVELDIRKFFDTVPWDKVVAAVEAHTDAGWVVLYVKRWLAAGLRLPDGSTTERVEGTPQGSAVSPVLANLCFCTMRSMRGWSESTRAARSSVTPMMRWCTAAPWRKRNVSWPRCGPGWPRSVWSCIRTRPGSCTARTTTVGAGFRSPSSRSWGSRSGREEPRTDTG
jgi:group II intron reverse transcriptase/maturase